MTTADMVENLIQSAGDLPWGSRKLGIVDMWLRNLLSENWGDMTSVTFEDGSVWVVWTW